MSKRVFLWQGGESEDGISHDLAVAELLLRTGQEQQAHSLFSGSVARLRTLGVKNNSIAEIARARWVQATLLQGLRIDRAWSGSAIKAHAAHAAWASLRAHW